MHCLDTYSPDTILFEHSLSFILTVIMANVDDIHELLLMCRRVSRIDANVSEIAMIDINCIDGYNIDYALLCSQLSMENDVLTLDIYNYY